MKGIILAGGSGTRLYPITMSVSKQLLPVYDKPMIYYPLSTLMLAGIREILVITTPQDQWQFQQLLGDGTQYGLRLEYATQPSPDGRAVSLEEKPKSPRSNWAVTGLYFYDNRVLDVARALRPSARGELEITDVNKAFLEWEALSVEKLGRGIAWLDTGTHESLQQASLFIQALQERQGLMVACLEEIAYHLGWITAEDVARIAGPMKMNDYGRYLLRMLGQGAQAR